MPIASVVFASPLPQLDRVFDYLVPDTLLGKLQFGMGVKVPFGNSKAGKTGIVVALAESSAFKGKLQEIEALASNHKVLTKEQYELVLAVASRQAAIPGELLNVCLPKRSARAEANFKQSIQQSEDSGTMQSELPVLRQYITPGLLDIDVENHWSRIFVSACEKQIESGRSVLVVLPDFRDLAIFEEALAIRGLQSIALRQTSGDSVVVRWNNHLRAVSEPARIVYGTRNVAFSPAKDLGLILVWDEGDDSHHEQSSPYWNTRDVLLQRSELEGVSITFSSHSPSSEISRLVEIGYLQASSVNSTKAIIRVTNSTERLDSESFALISRTLAENRPVLVQIANLGFASALACVSCKEIKRCDVCQTALWLDPKKELRCRGCKTSYPQLCSCGGKTFRAISQGSHALSEQLARSFPKAHVVHSTGSDALTQVETGGVLVIATPGAEPSIKGGYAVILLADAQSMVGLPRLRALEQACRKWANAIAHLSNDGIAIAVGLSGNLAIDLKACDFSAIVKADMLERSELGLPPASRIVSISGKNKNDLIELAEDLNEIPELAQLPTSEQSTVAYSYSIANGAMVAAEIRRITALVARRSKNKLPGQRVLFINMDDNKVI